MSDRAFDWLRLLFLAVAVGGLLLSGQLVAYHLGGGLPDVLEWACGGPLNCRTVLGSEYAMVSFIPPRPVPVAVIGLAYFTLLGIWLLVVGRLPGAWQRLWAVPAIIGLLGVLGSVFFLYVMARKLHAWCGLCVGVHAANLLLVPGLWWLWLARCKPAPPGPPATPPAGLWKVPAMALLASLAIGVAQVRYVQASDADRAAEQVYRQLDAVRTRHFLAAQPKDVPIGPDDPVLGPADAPHTVVIFSDFQCAACATTGRVLRDLQGRLQNAFRIVYKDFPLNADCNPSRRGVPAGGHEQACQAAAAAEAARRLGGNEAFWKMYNLLFEILDKHPALSAQPYDDLAGQMGLDVEPFNRLRQDPQVVQHIREDATVGAALGANATGTPVVFLDGRLLEDPIIHRGRKVLMTDTLRHWQYLLFMLDRQRGTATRPTTAPASAPATQVAEGSPLLVQPLAEPELD